MRNQSKLQTTAPLDSSPSREGLGVGLQVRRIEIKTRALSNNVFAGEYHSAFKGRGMSFSEVREYQPGDDVRDIDWNVTARMDRTYVKVYEEERELTVMLVIDVSGSLDFGTRQRTQRELLTEIAATLAFSAAKNNDKIGAIFVSDRVEQYIPPKKGRSHILHIVRTLLTLQPESRKTDMAVGLEFLSRVQRKRCIAFLMSDFLDETGRLAAERGPLPLCARRHDVVALRVYDPVMAALPNVGLIEMRDAETGNDVLVNTSSAKVRRQHAQWWTERQKTLDDLFLRNRVDSVSIATDGDYVKALQQLFNNRHK